jgi:hypothetical protein
MNLSINNLIQKINQTIINVRSKKLATNLLNLTDNQLKGLGLNRYVIIHKIAAKDWTVLNFDKTSTANPATQAAININATPSANDEAIQAAA